MVVYDFDGEIEKYNDVIYIIDIGMSQKQLMTDYSLSLVLECKSRISWRLHPLFVSLIQNSLFGHIYTRGIL